MAEPEYPVLKELETKLKLLWVDTDDVMATQRAIIQVEPDHAYLELPRGRKGDKGDPGNAINFQGIVARTSDLPAGLTAADAAKAWVNTATKALHVWNGDQWFTVDNFAGVDADVQRFSQWFAQAADAARTALDAADRAEYWANETIQQVAGDFATKNYVDAQNWSKGLVADADAVIEAGAGHTNDSTLNLPEGRSSSLGALETLQVGSTFSQRWASWTTPYEVYRRSKRVSGGWYEWENAADEPWDNLGLVADTEAVTSPGAGYTNTGTTSNLPDDAGTGLGSIEYFQVASTLYARWTAWGLTPSIYTRSQRSDKSWYPWIEVTGGGDKPVARGTAGGLKTVPLALSTGHGNSSDGVASGSFRVPLNFAAPIVRWRLAFVNRNPRYGTIHNTTATVSKVTLGKDEGGGKISSPVTVDTNVTVPTNGGVAYTDWCSTPITGAMLLGYKFTSTGSNTPPRLLGGGWDMGTADPASTAATGTRTSYVSFDMWVEAEVENGTPVVAAFGDSLTAGLHADVPVHDSWLSQYARGIGALPVHYAHSGDGANSWAGDLESYKWTRWAHLDLPDGVIYQLGSNDLSGDGDNVPTLKANTTTIVEHIAETITPNVYAGTITPRNSWDSATEAERTTYNAWLRTLPAGIRDVFDPAAAVGNGATLKDEYQTDGTHLNTAGYGAWAGAITRKIVATPKMDRAAVESALETKADKTEAADARWWKTPTLATGTNFDDVRDPSIRIMLGGTHESAPFNAIGTLEVLPTGYNGVIQRATNWGKLEVWKRRTQGGVFQPWVREPTLADVNAVQALIPSTQSIQDTIDEALSDIDIPGTTTDWTRRVPLAVTTGAGPSEGPGSGRYRMKVQFTAPIIRWRLHISTEYTIGGTPGSASTLWLVRVGNHTGNAVMGQSTELMSGSAAVPSGGEWISGWTTHRLDTESIIDVSFTASGSTRNFLAPAWKLDGESWVQTNRAPLWVWIEAETYKDTPTVALIGDSTGAGHGSITPVWDSAVAIAGRKQEFLPVLFASSGDTLSGNVSIDDPNFVRWSDYGTYDSVVIQAGSNDINSGKTLAEVQASFTSVAAAAKELGAKVYGATIKPRYPTGPNTKVREYYNDWLKTLPAGIAGVLDYSTAVAPDGVILPEDNDDGSHLKSSGHHKMAAAYSFPIARPRVVGTWKP